MAERQTGSVEAAAAAMRALPVRQRNRLLFDLLAEAGATGIVVPGANGEMEGNLGDHRLRTKAPGPDSAYGEAVRETVAVAARPVDAPIDAGRLIGPVLVKADVQGAEAQALAGGGALFDRADLAMLEYRPYGLRRLGTEPAALFAASAEHFPYAALLADDQAPETVQLLRFDDLTADLITAEEENRTVALDLVLSKERTPLWTG